MAAVGFRNRIHIKFMGLNVLIDVNKFFAVFTAKGFVTFEEIQSGFDSLSRHPRFFKRMPVIWDLRQGNLSGVHRHIIEKIVAYFEKRYPLMDSIRMACVAETDLQHGLSKLIHIYMDENVVEFKIFKDFNAAVE